ncbi:MAG: ABC transporter ATP-binding protein [Proteobacteria bacterium]|nr:ABC transporter ATP-binding protein [Pseudomonadota bacterium]
MTFLDIRSVGKRYGDVTALENVGLSVPKGSRTAIVGPSGSGKTTLLRVIAGFESQDTGRIVLDGIELADGPRAIPAHRRSIGFVPQDGALFPHLDVAANIGFGLAKDDPHRAARVGELMALVELPSGMAARRPHELSGGQQQRVALARALAREPKLMLLDEPFSALDTGLRATMRKAVASVLSAVGITAILVTHDQAEALSFANLIAVMREGRLIQAGSPRDLYSHPADRHVATFLGDAIVLRARIDGMWASCELGRVRIEQACGSGDAEIMVRPEQVRLESTEPSATTLETGYGHVVDVEFAGAGCTVSVRLAGGSEILVPCPGNALPAVGATVRISVAGPAHVFGPKL